MFAASRVERVRHDAVVVDRNADQGDAQQFCGALETGVGQG